ncbi:DUF4232 domain-containing protein [Streptomyces sp. 8N114]|uniref:DUF4232 domain-containing protein n=1 Tax=Streptomyces sp. 8N114 TaxID=3457419 RepID=UPI003FD03B55
MRSRLATRSTRLVLAAAAATALTTAAAATASADAGSKGSEIGAVQKNGAERTCATGDLTFSVSEETQAGGYFLVTAEAKPGVTCYLEGTIPSASFGSGTGKASPAEHGVTDPVKLSGSTAAYAGISPKSTNNDDGEESGRLAIAVAGDKTNPVTLKLPETTLVDEPITTNWHADPADAVPYAS